MKLLLWILIIGFTSLSTRAATAYYIDPTTGADSNPGTKVSPWLHLPIQAQFSGTYNYQSGDSWVTPHGKTIRIFGTLTMTSLGSSPVPLSNFTLGATDPTWGTGTNNTVFDFGGVELNASHFDVGILIPANNAATGLSFVNIDFSNLYWDGNPDTNPSIAYAWAAYISKTGVGTMTVNGCRFLNWSHSAWPSSVSRMYCIYGSGAGGGYDGIITNCVFDGGPGPNSTQSASSGGGTYAWGGDISHCQIRNVGDGFIVTASGGRTQTTEFSDIGPVFLSYDYQRPGGAHPDNLFMNGGTKFLWHDNYIHDAYVLAVFTGEGSGSEDVWFYNNVVYNAYNAAPFTIDNLFSGAREWIWNNTIVGGSFFAVRVANKGHGQVGVVSLLDNLLISDAGAVTIDAGQSIFAYTNANNVLMGTAAATAAGYTLANLYKPPTSAAATVGAGQNLSSVLAGALTKDILGVTRPQGGNWDASAYQFQTGGTGPGTLSFTAGLGSCVETDGTLPVVVSRTSGTTGAVGATVSTTAGTAIPGVNYTTVSTTVSWAGGDSANKTVNIPILVQPFNGSKNFTVNLSAATGGATVAAPSVQTVTITGSSSSTNPPVFGLNFEAEAGSYAPDFGFFSNGAVSGIYNQNNNGTIYGQTGIARWKFTNAPGPYRIYIVSAAVDTASNSHWIDINNPSPNDPTNIWDIPITGNTNTFTTNAVSLRGGGSPDIPEFPANVWTLAGGTNELDMMPREAGGYLDRIMIVSASPVTNNPPAVIASTVNAVSAAPGYFGPSTLIPITVSFSTNVFVTGSPLLSMNTSANAVFAAGSGTSNLTFNLSVQTGQNTQLLDVSGTNALALNGGTIKDALGTNAVLLLPVPGQAGSISYSTTLVVDTINPAINIGAPNPPGTVTNNGATVMIPVNYTDLNFNNSTLALSSLVFTITGDAAIGSVVVVAGSGPTQSILLSGFQGRGTASIQVKAGSASDKAGNLAPASTFSVPINIDAPRVRGVVLNNVLINNATIP